MHLDLKRLDLNLLLVFEAVYRLRSVTRAAAELALSASALSHALIRLRKALADELFYRVGNDMHPTVYADSRPDRQRKSGAAGQRAASAPAFRSRRKPGELHLRHYRLHRLRGVSRADGANAARRPGCRSSCAIPSARWH